MTSSEPNRGQKIFETQIKRFEKNIVVIPKKKSRKHFLLF